MEPSVAYEVDGVDLLDRLEQVQQVGVLHAVEDGNLVHEPLPRVVVRDLALLQHLDSHRLASVPLHRQHDLAERALPHRLEQGVVADGLRLGHARPRLRRAHGTAALGRCLCGGCCEHCPLVGWRPEVFAAFKTGSRGRFHPFGWLRRPPWWVAGTPTRALGAAARWAES